MSHKDNILWPFAYVIIEPIRFLAKHIHWERSTQSVIGLMFKRLDVCIENKESGNKEKDKLYPEYVETKWDNGSEVLLFKLPAGLDLDKITNAIPAINDFLKKQVIFKFLENNKDAHFSLKILSGNLHDRIEIVEVKNNANKH